MTNFLSRRLVVRTGLAFGAAGAAGVATALTPKRAEVVLVAGHDFCAIEKGMVAEFDPHDCKPMPGRQFVMDGRIVLISKSRWGLYVWWRGQGEDSGSIGPFTEAEMAERLSGRLTAVRFPKE